MDKEDIFVKTLSDDVTEVDELGSHQRIADTIAQLVKTERQGCWHRFEGHLGQRQILHCSDVAGWAGTQLIYLCIRCLGT